MALAVAHRDLVQVPPLATAEQAVEDLAHGQRCQHRDVLRAGQEAHQAQRGVEQRRIDAVQIDPARSPFHGLAQRRAFGHQGGDHRRVDIQADTEVRLAGGGLQHATGHRHSDRDHQVMQRIVGVELIAQAHLLAALHDDAQRRLVQPVHQFARRAAADQEQIVDSGGMHAVVAHEAIDQPRQGGTLGNRFLGGMKVQLVHLQETLGRQRGVQLSRPIASRSLRPMAVQRLVHLAE